MAESKFKSRNSRPRKTFKYEDAPERPQRPQREPSVIDMVKKMQQQLMFLERKIDTLISQSSSGPSRSDGRFNRHKTGSRDDGSGPVDFRKGKKPFFSRKKPRD
ncbi:MAG: hypothetical protein GY853_00105 [PVC group bacterium]|nr:hypothetical protein [PVC group bacterium]